jgi:LssY C-terminus
MSDPPTSTERNNWSRPKRIGLLAVGLALGYVTAAYLVMPFFWTRYADRHPELEDQPGMAYTADGIPADPINVALIGTQTEVMKILLAAKWYPADPLTLRSCLKIAEASVFKRPDEDAPVSSEYLFGRKEDLSFEQAVGPDPRQRHHVRFWKSEKADADGRPIWLGSAIFDKRVGLSRTTGQITHETAPDIDAERDKLFDDLKQTGDLSKFEIVEGFHKVLEGKNGEGNPWQTDGNLYEGWIDPALPSNAPQTKEPKP